MGEPVDTSAETVLVRFGLQWNGPREFVSTPMADGYWTPWHVADSALNAAQQRIADLERQYADGLAAWRANNAHHAAVIDRMRAKLLELAGDCAECGGEGLVTIRGMCGGVEMDCDDQPCPDCEDIRGEAMAAKGDDWLTREARQIGLHSPACASFGQNECDCGAAMAAKEAG